MVDATRPAGAANKANPKIKKIPVYLMKEVIDGKPFYYAGSRAVLTRRKTLDDIMPDSSMQRLIYPKPSSFQHDQTKEMNTIIQLDIID